MKALLLVDIQNDFCPGGALAVSHGDHVVPVANRLMASGAFDFVVATKDFHPANHSSFASNNAGAEIGDCIMLDGIEQMMWPDHCVQNTPGAEFHPDLDTSRIDETVFKGTDPAIDSYSAFYDNKHLRSTGLADMLRDKGVTSLVICGLATDYCVDATARDAVSEGFAVTVATDGCRAVDPSPAVSDCVFEELRDFGCTCVESDSILAGIK